MTTEEKIKTILLVEDEGIIALDEARTLQKNGYKVITVPSGEKAVDVFKETPNLDLVLMDINLGSGMDGTRAAEIILAHRDIPLIFLSSHTEPEVVEKTEGITSYGYVVKGSGETVLIASIKMAFRLFEARTQERLKDEALQLSERQLKIITDTIPAYVAYVGLDDLRYRFVNTRFEESYKLPRHQIIGSHIKDVIGQSNYEFAKKYLDIVRQGQATSYENSFVTAGTERWVNVNYVPEINENGEPEAVVVLSFDITDRKEMENLLKEREKRLRLLFDTMTEGVALNEIIYDENGEMVDYRVLEVNQAFYSTADYQGDEVVGNVATKLYGMTPEFIKEFWKIHRLKDETAYAEMHRPDSNKWFFVATSPFVEDKFVTSFIDITELKQTQEQLRFQADLLKAIEQAVIVTNMDGQVIYWNPFAEKLYGWSAEEALGKTSIELTTSEGTRHEQAEILDQLQAGKSWSGEHIAHHRNGTALRIQSSMTPTFNARGELSQIIEFSSVVTERAQAENAVDRGRDLLSATLDALPVGVCLTDESGHYQMMNDAYCAIYEYDRSEMIGQHYSVIMPEDQIAQANTQYARLLDGDTGIPVERKRQRKDGSIIYIEAANALVKDGDGNKMVITTVREITERKQAEESLQVAFEEKQDLLKELQHRAKNSFAMINSLVNLMESTAQGDEASSMLSNLGERVRAIAELYNLLYVTDSFTETRLDEYIKKIVTSFPSAGNIKFKQTYEPVTIPVKYAAALGLIVTELITNALKHAFPDNRPGMILISLINGDDGAIIEVTDNGVGIPDDFDLTISNTLGLTVIQSLCQQVKGNFRIEHENGTRCIVEFPLG